jgi:hypothetical protein
MNTRILIWVSALLAVVLDIYFVLAWRRYRRSLAEQGGKLTAKSSQWRLLLESMFPDKVKNWCTTFWRSDRNRQATQALVELLLIGLWAIWVGRDYLDMNPLVTPAGREFGSAIQAHHLWTRFEECGSCALWDGSERGGFPAFVDPLGSSLHPAVILTTLLLGVVNGSKVMVIISLWIAGLAQWWLGRVLKLSWLPRMWGAALVVVGGHLSGRMELGALCSLLSTAAVSLTLAPAIRLSQTGSKRDAVILAIVLAMMAVAGQGYYQAGFLFMAPAYLILILSSKVGEKLLWKRYLTAAGLGLLLAAPFLVPFIHFFPNFLKNSDPYFNSVQPLPYYLLNLLIDDFEFFNTTVLGHLPFPNLYTMFVGWIPVILAIVALSTVRRKDRRPISFLATSAALVLWFGTAQPLQWVQGIFPGVASLRFISVIGGLAVPCIIALAAYALDKLMKFNWPRLALVYSETSKSNLKGFRINLLLIIPLLINVYHAYDFSQSWYYTIPLHEHVAQVLERLQTPDLQWVHPPFGEHFYVEPAVQMKMKLSAGFMTWRWRGREFPEPVIEASHSEEPRESYQLIDDVNGIRIYERYDLAYASIVNDEASEFCTAKGLGGELTVDCDTAIEGKLVVQENTWTGWKAWRDGQRVPLIGERWLEVDAPAGKHTYEFRYRPWDVPVGLGISILGIVLCIGLWFHAPKEEQEIKRWEQSEEQIELSEGEE